MLNKRHRPSYVHGVAEEVPPIEDREAFLTICRRRGEKLARGVTVVPPALFDCVITTRYLRTARREPGAGIGRPTFHSIATKLTRVICVHATEGQLSATQCV